jgi:hypothetical protein
MTGRVTGLLTGAAALVAGAPMALAQSAAVGAGGAIDGTTIPSATCAQTFVVGVTVTCARTGPDGAFFEGSGRGDAGGFLRGDAYAEHDGAATLTIASVSASWLDSVTFTPFAVPVTGFIYTRLRGTQAASTDGDGTVAAITNTIMRLRIWRDGDFVDPAATDEETLVRQLVDGGIFQSHSLGRERITRGVSGGFTSTPISPAITTYWLAFAFEIEPGVSSIVFNWQFATNALVQAGWNGWASTSYFSTASLLGFQFVDASGRDVTAAANPVFPSGQDYPLGKPPGFGVPTPASLGVLGLGVALLAAVRRRARTGPAQRLATA